MHIAIKASQWILHLVVGTHELGGAHKAVRRKIDSSRNADSIFAAVVLVLVPVSVSYGGMAWKFVDPKL